MSRTAALSQRQCPITPVALAYALLFVNLLISAGWEVLTKLVLSKLDINLLTLAFYRQCESSYYTRFINHLCAPLSFRLYSTTSNS